VTQVDLLNKVRILADAPNTMYPARQAAAPGPIRPEVLAMQRQQAFVTAGLLTVVASPCSRS